MHSSMPGIHSGIWLIGLAILFFTGLWWPGILVLVGISMVLQWIFSESSTQTRFEQAPQPAPRPVIQTPAAASTPAPQAAPIVTPPAALYHPVQLLPPTCSHCGGPVRAYEVKWTGARSAVCAYCGSGLTLKKD
jgi:hypothetical protein